MDAYYADGLPKDDNEFIKIYKPLPEFVRHWSTFNNTQWIDFLNKGEVGGQKPKEGTLMSITYFAFLQNGTIVETTKKRIREEDGNITNE